MTITRRMTRQEAEDFLDREAQLIDSGRLEEWLELFTPDGIYWLPIDEAADPEREPSIVHDDSPQRAKRIYQFLRGPHYAQMPPSRTVHFVSNVETGQGDEEVVRQAHQERQDEVVRQAHHDRKDEATVMCNLLVFELRPGDHQDLQVALGQQRALVGRCEYRLRHQQEGWRIALKKVLLIDRDLPLYNLTFII